MKQRMILMTTTSQTIERKRVENLFKNFQKDRKSVFYSFGNLSKSILNESNKSVYEKDKVFVNLYKPLEDKNVNKKLNVPLVTPFLTQKNDVDHSTLYSISKPYDLVHGDIADTKFLAKSTVDPKYCLLPVDLFTSKIYVFPIKTRSLLSKKLKSFDEEIQKKKKKQEK